MVLIKQLRETDYHPEGAYCLVPIELEFQTVLVSKHGAEVMFAGQDFLPGPVHWMSLATYRAVCKRRGCCCASGLLR